MKKKATIIVNPTAGTFSEKRIDEATRSFKSKFNKIDVFYTQNQGDATNIATQQIEEKPDLIVVAGGDGTLNEVINGIVYSGIPLGFIPLGTTNVLAHEFSLPRDTRGAVNKILAGKSEYVSTGLINGRHFLMAAGIGFDGTVVYQVNSNFKKKMGKAAYVLSGFDVFRKYAPGELKISVDNSFYYGYGLIVCNSKYYGGAFQVCPDASVQLSTLSVFIMHGSKRSDLIQALIYISTGKHDMLSNVTLTTGKTITVMGHAHIQVDGDYLDTTPAAIQIQPNALKFCS